MRKTRHEILKRTINPVKLVSLTAQYWYGVNGELIPWSGDTLLFPHLNEIVFNTNVTTELTKGYYRWNSINWDLLYELTDEEKNNLHYNVNSKNFETFNLPIILDNTINDLGVMVEFDGDISQIEQKCNFTHTGSGKVITLYNTVNTNQLPALISSVFTIFWGDGTNNTLAMPYIGDANLPYISHTYTSNGLYTIKVTVDSPWGVDAINKEITIPIPTGYTLPIDFGVLTFTVPYSNPELITTQQYLEDYSTTTGKTNPAVISFIGVGKSRLIEKRLYGTKNKYTGVDITPTYTGYSLNGLYYMDYPKSVDYPRGYTHITGTTSGDTISFFDDEIYNGMITRNEFFLGFTTDPLIYSDILVDRGKIGVIERNFRLAEIDNVGELEVYGNGYFIIRKQ